MNLKYEIIFFDYWHLSSGLSGGTKLDSSVTKDSDGIAYVPGKTIKGLLREMAEEMSQNGNDKIICDFINTCFGGSADIKADCYDEDKKNIQGVCYFSNANLKKETIDKILDYQLQDNLYDTISSTKIGTKDTKDETEGIAVDNSLREIEVVVPLTLCGEIRDIPDDPKEYKDNMIQILELIKRMGLNRNRGLGRCKIKTEALSCQH